MHIQTAKGVSFYVEIQGKGVPLIWTHGLTMSVALDDAWNIFPWQKISEHCQLIRYDARGHGKSQTSVNKNDYTWSSLANDLLELADALSIDKFIAGGASMGCAAALYATLKSPERIAGLILNVCPSAWDERAQTANQYFIGAKLIEEKGIQALMAARKQMPTPELFKNETRLLEIVDANLKKYDPAVLSALLQGAGISNLPAANELQFKMPALILAWNNFLNHPLSTAQKLHALMPNSELFIAENLTQARQQASQVIDFLFRATNKQK